MKKNSWLLRWIECFGRLADALHILLCLAAGFLGAWLAGGILDLGVAGYVIGFLGGLLIFLGGP